jgi:hypothetical protein
MKTEDKTNTMLVAMALLQLAGQIAENIEDLPMKMRT